MGKKDLARILAEEYVRIHNEASPKFKAAFKRIGARMWQGDDAHLLKEYNVRFVAKTIRGYFERGHPEYVRRVYGHAVVHPLTVMDSYPQCRRYRKQLEAEIYPIFEQGNREWSQFLKRNGI